MDATNNMLMSLNEMNGKYQLVVDGMLTTSENVVYSNVVFKDLTFNNNSPIVNSQLNIYNNMMITGSLANAYATNVYTVDYSNNLYGYTIGSFRNRILNASMLIDTITAGNVVNGTKGDNVVSANEWNLFPSANVSIQKTQDVPENAMNIVSALKIMSTGVDIQLTDDFLYLQTMLKPINFDDFQWGTSQASPVTVSFYVYTNRIGTYCVSLENNGIYGLPNSKRGVCTTVIVSETNKWVRVSCSLPGDTNMMWSTTNLDLYVKIWLLYPITGTSLLSDNTWQYITDVTDVAETGNYGFYDSPTNFAYITEIQLEKGMNPSPFEYRPSFIEEILLGMITTTIPSTLTTESINTTTGDIVSGRNLAGKDLWLTGSAYINNNININSNIYCNSNIICNSNISAQSINSTTGDITSGRNLVAVDVYANSANLNLNLLVNSNIICNSNISAQSINSTLDITSSRNVACIDIWAQSANINGNINGVDCVLTGSLTCDTLISTNQLFSEITIGPNTSTHYSLSNCIQHFAINNTDLNVLNFKSRHNDVVHDGVVDTQYIDWSHQFTEWGGAYRADQLSAWNVFSDRRLKENITDINDGLEKILKLRPVSFNWKNKHIHNRQNDYGFIAQDFMEVFPDYVQLSIPRESEKKYIEDGVCYSIVPEILPWIVNSIQQLNSRIALLENHILK
jgi:hypothetical protein